MLKILFICTHNRCRSILAEAIARHVSEGALEVRSAGSQPAGQVFPGTLRYLESQGMSVDGLQSQSWDELESFAPDIVITVCDSAAGEACPLWMGDTARVHWGLPDPSKQPDEALQQEMFGQLGQMMQQRLTLLAEAPLETLQDRDSLESAVGQLLTSGRTS
ncbi:arsenate reductase ArsC [uncultured Thalassolituus sp.]|uniref:arsenate reductase ArsC n=1 Tax=uncultured Thalassolituus sp. TaxID=285273 RepID=UPI0026375D90|nr:arsenate reductase ArsC [uncultured Thalassolituus sp.]